MTNNFFKNNYTAVLGSESRPGPDLDQTVDSLTIDEPYAHKLGSILADFAHSTRLTETKKWKSHCLQIILLINRYYCSINHIMVV